jgi:adenylate cyclase
VTAGARFCGECGQAFDRPAAVPGPESAPLDGERKQVTVLFADVAGSVALSESLDPEDWARIMDRFFGLLTDGVRRFGGTVDKFTGDGIMALFGAPRAQEDHARRAGHAALALTQSVGTFAADLRASHGLNLHVRIGLNSGEVVVGRVGGAGSDEYTAVGHTVGLAQRMEALAEPGTCYLTEHTARLVPGEFRLEDLGRFPVKGSTDPVRVYRLTAAGTRRRGVGRWPGRAPLVGRTDEMAGLEAALERAKAGHGQVVGLVGEAGVGKSRLCEEFVARCAAEGHTVRRASGLSHAQGVPLLPILEFYRDYFGITDADRPQIAREKIAGRLLLLDTAFEEALPLVFDFLQVPDPDRPAPHVAAEARLRRLFALFRQIAQRRSEREVLVILFEDLHWFDPQSDAFLQDLMPLYPTTRTLVVANYRPEYEADWMRLTSFQRLPLPPLSATATGELIESMLGRDPSVSELAGHIANRTEGNPFFIEEAVRALVEDGTLGGDPGAYHLARPLGAWPVPATVKATLAARIDRLPAEERTLLQTASVIGRTFSEAVLEAVSERPPERLAADLKLLCQAEFLQEVAAWPSAEYRFWHPLTQEVAYGTLLSDRRARIHAAVATALADLDPGRQEERAALIAAHYGEAGALLEAARWEDRAATWGRLRDLPDAIGRWHRILEMLARLPDGPETMRLAVSTRAHLLRCGSRTGMPTEEADLLSRDALDLSGRLGDAGLAAWLQGARGSYHFTRGEFVTATGHYRESLRLAEEAKDAGLSAAGLMLTALGLTYVGPLAKALELFEAAIAHTDGDPDLGARQAGFSLYVQAHNQGGVALVIAGQPQAGRARLEEALRCARDRPEVETLAWTMANLVHMLDLIGNDDVDLVALALEADRLTEELGSPMADVITKGALGTALAAAGRFEEAAVKLGEALAIARDRQAGRFQEVQLLVDHARVEVGLGRPDRAVADAHDAVAAAQRQGAPVTESLALLGRARIHRASGDPAAARADIRAGLALAESTGAAIYGALLAELDAELS